MLNSIKEYFRDYVAAQKTCNEFNRKHWKGNIVFTLVITGVTFGGLYAAAKVSERKKRNDDILSEE